MNIGIMEEKMETIGITGVLFGLYRGLYWENLNYLPNEATFWALFRKQVSCRDSVGVYAILEPT